VSREAKPTLSVEEHVAYRAQMTDVCFIRPKYSDETVIDVSGIFRKWRRYVELSFLEPPSQQLCFLMLLLDLGTAPI
jgi:hypothetical protein